MTEHEHVSAVNRRAVLRAGVGGLALGGVGTAAADDDGRGPLSRHADNFEMVGHSPLRYRG